MRYQVRERLLRLGEDNDILNEAGEPVYQVDGKVLSLHGLMVVNDLAGNKVGTVSRKLISLLATYEVALAGGVNAEVHQRFSSPLRPTWNISVAGGAELEVTGNFLGHDFTFSESGQTGAASTLVAAAIDGTSAVIGNLGDSRAYLLRDGRLNQLTKDHSYVQEQVDAGYLTPEQARSHPYSNVITRCVGANNEVVPDVYAMNATSSEAVSAATKPGSPLAISSQKSSGSPATYTSPVSTASSSTDG